LLFALMLAVSPLALRADTIFSDTFTTSTLNQPNSPTTPTSTTYQTYVGLDGQASSISPGHLTLAFPTAGVLGEVLGLFTNSVMPLTTKGDYVEVDIVFKNVTNILSDGTGTEAANATLNIGLFNSGGFAPNPGPMTTSTTNITGGTQNWTGYVGRIFFNGNANVLYRPVQGNNFPATSQNQELLFSNASSSQAFKDPAGTGVGGNTLQAFTVNEGGTYTVQLVVTLTNSGPNAYAISNALYSGVGTSGTPINSQIKTDATGLLTSSGFDGFAFGWRNSASPSITSVVDIASITVLGHSTPVIAPPTITLQPVPISVPSGQAGAYTVAATGIGLNYQWRRTGTNLVNGGNISGATTPTLQIYPVGASDAQSTANGYSVIVGGAGGFTTNSVTNSLTIVPATNLVWSAAGGPRWDLNNTAAWHDTNGVTTVFNFGDPVLFDDTAGIANETVTVSNVFLAPASMTISSSGTWTFQGPGSIAGPTKMFVTGGGEVILNEPNIYNGGTIISNNSTEIRLDNLGGLGNGPVTLAVGPASPFPAIEVSVVGSGVLGINGDIHVLEDATIQFDGTNTFAGVIFGGLYGTAGKTLTFEPSPSTFDPAFTHRIRVYGTNTSYDANLFLDGPSVSQAVNNGTMLATYNSAGSQTYNGVISGNGGIIQRGILATFNGQNTYSGGTVPSTGAIGLGCDTVGSVTSGPIGVGPLYVVPELPNLTGSGQIFAANGARTIANPIVFPSGTNNQTLIVGGTNNLTLTGAFGLRGADGNLTFTNRLLTVTNLGLTTISGVIGDAGADCGFTKNGAGVLALANTETYTGPTLVSGGTLRVNGQVGPGPLTITNNSTLGGTGTITAPVYIATNSVLAPGNSIGVLTINSNLTLNGNMFIEVNKAGSPTSDKTVVNGTLANTGTGTVTVTNLGTPLSANDRFVLFNKAVTGGGTMSVTGGSVTWSNGLAVDGSITVLSTTPTTPTNITVTTTATGITMSWPTAYQGWSLQSNSVGILSTNSWFTVPGSSGGTSVTVNYDKTKTNVFYRMSLP